MTVLTFEDVKVVERIAKKNRKICLCLWGVVFPDWWVNDVSGLVTEEEGLS